MDFSSLRIAFVHDWLTGIRGGERVLEELIEIFGPRDLYTLVCDHEKLSGPITSCRIHTSFLQKLPGCRPGISGGCLYFRWQSSPLILLAMIW